MVRKFTIANCTLNQWALDFHGNKKRILLSCRKAKEGGAAYRCGPESEITGYGCEDHFLENDTLTHSWEVLAELIKSPDTEGLICDVGMPVIFKGVRYNCRVVFHNKQIVLIRPKLHLAMDGIYYEARWFTAWSKYRVVETMQLPAIIVDIAGQETAPFGDTVLSTSDAVIGYEICEELYIGPSTHIAMSLDGVEVCFNGSGLHYALRQLCVRVKLVELATAKCGGVYVLSNCKGCDGGRVYFDGTALVSVNGEFVSQGNQFSLSEVDVDIVTVDLDDVVSYRGAIGSRGPQVQHIETFPRTHLPIHVCNKTMAINKPIKIKYYTPEEEIMLDAQVISDVRRILRLSDDQPIPATGTDMAGLVFTTSYMATANSSPETERLARQLATQIGSQHLTINIDEIVSSLMSAFSDATNLVPKFKVHGGTDAENIALQNVQARSRMVMSYLFSQLMPWTKGKNGSLLVLGSANTDESLFGYLTKYDCSSADINPIGGMTKLDLRDFCKYLSQTKYPALREILLASPTAELEPITEFHHQIDEEDMGMTYQELSEIGQLRKIYKCGPLSMFLKLADMWKDKTPTEVAEKVKRFFTSYAINRHKATVATPSLLSEMHSPDDNRLDMRQFLYNCKWTYQFEAIDKEVLSMNETQSTVETSSDAILMDKFKAESSRPTDSTPSCK